MASPTCGTHRYELNKAEFMAFSFGVGKSLPSPVATTSVRIPPTRRAASYYPAPPRGGRRPELPLEMSATPGRQGCSHLKSSQGGTLNTQVLYGFPCS